MGFARQDPRRRSDQSTTAGHSAAAPTNVAAVGTGHSCFDLPVWAGVGPPCPGGRGGHDDAGTVAAPTVTATTGTGATATAGGSPAPKKTVSVYPVSLPGSTRSASPDITRADAVWAQCSVSVKEVGGQTWQTNVLDQLAPTGVLNEYSNPSSPTTEESALLAHQPGGPGMIHAYFVPAMSSNSRGESFWPAVSATSAVIISDSAASDSLAHELGHVLLNDGGHHRDPDNLLAAGANRNVGVDKLDAAQCAKI